MRAVYYENPNGSAREVRANWARSKRLNAGAGEVRVKLATSGVNPSDVKSRQGATPQNRLSAGDPAKRRRRHHRRGRPRARQSRIGERVWVWNGQWKRAFGTAAE